ncbi:uncharacterized protein EI90DRAFT_1861699 [Cantharellus anzutake]|uniref:uncharacterized protein n=1 Tax=Cantharellus anzutake TaxID=1750568 RepID=UPI0019078BFE|nr:uncharacterized protein EI90DRAFT_1861699 [Cantharellus anzutake]KAF8308290.1 hypothetical protein EI90DRAFT_1861699 [Cantharellus anzutake]
MTSTILVSPSPYNFNGSFNIRFRDHRAIRKKRVYEKVSESFIMKGSWPPRAKKDVEHNMYQASKGEFGTATLLSSHEPLNSRGCKSTNSYNSYFLPGPNLKFSDFHLKDIGSICPEEPDYRTLAVTLLRDQGCSLEYCDTAWDLCICLAHAMLGWLSTYQCGYMQRDVSIGNVLKLTQPIKTAPFNINKLHEFHDAIMRDNKSVGELSDAVRDKVMALDLEGGIHDSKTAQEAKDEVRKVMSAAEALQGGIAELGLSVDATECWAIISDGDLASYIPTYLTRTVTAESISGTYEFMSPGVHLAIEKKTPYLHSPLDEMFSFFYVALWATFWNIEKGHTPDEDLWRDGLRSKERDARVVGLLVERFTEASQTYAPIAAGMLPVLGDWWGGFRSCGTRSLRPCRRVEVFFAWYTLNSWHIVALQTSSKL